MNPDSIAVTNPNIVDAVDQAGLGSNGDAIAATLTAAGFGELKDAPLSRVEDALRSLASLITDDDELRRAMIREAGLRKLDEIGISAPGRLLDAALEKAGNGKADGPIRFIPDNLRSRKPLANASRRRDPAHFARLRPLRRPSRPKQHRDFHQTGVRLTVPWSGYIAWARKKVG